MKPSFKSFTRKVILRAIGISNVMARVYPYAKGGHSACD